MFLRESLDLLDYKSNLKTYQNSHNFEDIKQDILLFFYIYCYLCEFPHINSGIFPYYTINSVVIFSLY